MHIVKNSALTASLAAVASVLIVLLLVPLMGGEVTADALVMSALCPILIAGPASTYNGWRTEKLRRANAELDRAHAELALEHPRPEKNAGGSVMTGMLDRASFVAALEASHGVEPRGALLIIDADHFERINDSFGHIVGDEALLKIATAISHAMRKIGVVGRIGGEEFGAFLAGASDSEAARVAERIRHEVELIRFRPAGDRRLRLTVSVGGANCPAKATVSDLMRAADRRLYEAKESGRNLAIFEPRKKAA